MSEIKPMNLSGVSHNPLQGGAARGSISENMREGERIQIAKERLAADQNKSQQQILMQKAQLKMQEQMQGYRIKQQERAEYDYNLKLKTENFLFSNYPGAKSKTIESLLSDGLEFGDGTYNAHLKNWEKTVGKGNMEGFQKWYQHSRLAEQQNLMKALTFNPGIDISKRAHKKRIEKLVEGMSQEDLTQFYNSLDGPALQAFNEFNDGDFTFRENVDEFGASAWDHKGKIGTALGVSGLAWGIATKRIPPQAIKELWTNNGRVTKNLRNLFEDSSVRLGKNGLKEADLPGFIKQGHLTEAQAKILKDGGSVVPEMHRVKTNVKTGAKFMNIKVPHKNIKHAAKDINRYVQDGIMEQADGDKLKGILDDMIRKGEEITPENIGKRIMDGGDKFKGLKKTLQNNAGRIKGFGSIRMPGLLAGLGWYAGADYAGQKVAEAMGFEEDGQRVAGLTAGHGGLASGTVVNTVYKKIQELGAKKTMDLIIKKGGWKFASSLMAKGLLAGSGIGSKFGIAMLGYDLYTIADILTSED